MVTTSALRFQGSQEEFYTELRYFMTEAADNPEYFFQSGSVISGEGICGGSLTTFCSADMATKFEFSSSAITIDINLLNSDVERVWPSSKNVAWSGLGFLSGHQAVGVEILNLFKHLRT